MPNSDTLQIAPASHESLAEVFSLVFSTHEAQDALHRVRAALAEHRAGKLPCGGLLAARRGGQLVGATFAQVLPGRSATLYPPQLVPNEREETAERLVSEAIAHVRDGGVRVIHALLDGQPHASTVTRLEEAGFTPLAELYYLLAETIDFPTVPPEGVLTFTPCSSDSYERLCAVVEATYEATLDCPGLDGIRTAADVLEGYGTGRGTCPPHWFLIQHEHRDVGCLLLSDYGEHGNCELTYMGITPSVRGNGWGLLVTRQAQWITRSLGRERLVLAVDSTNHPARHMYASAGFRGWDRRHVYLLVLQP